VSVCDSHVHVFDPARFPYVTPRQFTPGTATGVRLQSHLRALGASRVVLVQPSVYGDQHDALLDALASLGPCARGIAVVSEHTRPNELSQLNAAGVVGTRINLVVDQLQDPALALARMQAIERRIPGHWHVQLHVHLHVLRALAPHIERSSRHYVLDHLGLPDTETGIQTENWTCLLRLTQRGKVHVKLSAPYLSSRNGPPYSELQPFVESLLRASASQLVWGSNWPHTRGTGRNPDAASNSIEPFRSVDDAVWLEACSRWAGPHAGAVLYGNAAQLYGFT
jgi:2-pyrone-4,6-dicarboxylate lactonase